MSVIERVSRGLKMLFAPVVITATDDRGPVHVAQIRVTPVETIDNVPVLQIYGLASHAPVGSEAAALFVAGDRSNPVIVATGNRDARLRNLKPGEVALYTGDGTFIKLSGKIVEMNAGTKIRITTPRLEVTGDVIDNCDSQSNDLADLRRIYNEHTHGGVRTGSDFTAPPLQPQIIREDDGE